MSLIDTVRDRFLHAIRSVDPPGKWKVVVVDHHSQKLIGAVLKRNDVLGENVTNMESISSNRVPQSNEAIYLLMPTSKNIKLIIDDFNRPTPVYSGAHLFFMDPLPEELFTQLLSSPAEGYLRRLSDLHINFRAIESQVFSLHHPHHFFSFFSPPPAPQAVASCRSRIDEDLAFTAKGLLNVLISIGENPLIRYYVPDHPPLGALADQASQVRSSAQQQEGGRWRGALATATQSRMDPSEYGDSVCKKLAFFLQRELDDYVKANPDFARTNSPNKPKPVFIITDRSMDMAAPFVHEFTYQAMVNDLLRIDGGVSYRYKFQSSAGKFEDQVVTLNEEDKIWTKIRHLHMQESINTLMGDFNSFMEENAGFTGKPGANSVNDMKDMLANLPQFKEQREKFSLHLNMAQESMDAYANLGLEAVARVEQNCATGLTAEGKTPKTLVEDMVPLLGDPNLSSRDKVRIISLYIMYKQGVPEEDKRRLYEHARLSLAEQDAVNSLSLLGVRVLRTPADRDLKKMKQKPLEDEYELSRFQPILKTILEDHINNKLDAAQFPYVRNAPGPSSASAVTVAPTTSLRSARPGWTKAPRQAGGVKEAKQRLLVYVVGGMTYSEMRTAYRVSDAFNKEIFIGSSHVHTPNAFIDDLKAVSNGGLGSKVIPDGLPNIEIQGEPRPFQMAYDQKYPIQDPPPPPRPSPVSARPSQNGSNMNVNNVDYPTQRMSNMSLNSNYAPSSASSTTGGKKEKDKDKSKKRFFGF